MTSKIPTAVYICRQPELIDAHDAITTELWEEYRVKIKALEEEWGVDTLVCSSGHRGQYISGYVEPDRKADPKPGFRREAHSDFMKPALRTKAGKVIAERIKGVSYVRPDLPGLPKWCGARASWASSWSASLVASGSATSLSRWATVTLRAPA